MNRIIAFIKRFFQYFSRKDETGDKIAELIKTKDGLYDEIKHLSDRTDHLNAYFKNIMAESDEMALENLKSQFKEVNDETMKTRQTVNRLMHEFKEMDHDGENPAIKDAIDELNEMMKPLNMIFRHYKAVQHVEIKHDAPETEPSDDSAPKEKKPIRTALEEVQSQRTVFINLTDEMREELERED